MARETEGCKQADKGIVHLPHNWGDNKWCPGVEPPPLPKPNPGGPRD